MVRMEYPMEHLADPGSHDGGSPTRAELLGRLAALQGKLASLAAIEQAKGALMVTYGLSADAAFALLRFHSQKRNVKIRAIADELTTLMSTSPSSAEGINRFDQLLDDVALSLQIPAADAVAPTTSAAVHPASTVGASWPELEDDEIPQMMLRAVATAPPGITIAGNGPDMPLVYANDAFADLTGYQIGNVLGRNCRFLQGPETDPRQVAMLSRAMHSGRDISVVMRNYRIDGSPFWNEVSISPIRNRTDQITHYVGTQIDITERVGRGTEASSAN